jgi:hypothetical protein
MKQDDWTDWESSEFLKLDQYEKKMMFGTPVIVTSQSAVFNLVWSYDIKVEDSRKKARCICDGSTRAGQVRVLDHTYSNCVHHTSGFCYHSNSLRTYVDTSSAYCLLAINRLSVVR